MQGLIMKTTILKPFYLVICSFLFISISCFAKPSQSLTSVILKPQAPDFELLDMDDEPHKLSDYKGKPVIINFWASWCSECRTELPSMNRAQTKLKNDGVALIAVNVGESEETIFTFANKYPIQFRVLRDESAKESKKWSIIAIPTTFVLDAKGRIIYQAVGPRKWDSDVLLDKIRALK